MLIKKEVFEKLKGYDSNLLYEDLDFGLDLQDFFQYDYIDTVVMHKRDVLTSLGNIYKGVSKKARNYNKSTYVIINKAIRSNLNKNELKAILKRVHYEFVLSLRTWHFTLSFKYVLKKSIYIIR